MTVIYEPSPPSPHKPRDLPMTTTACTNCGQWLDDEEALEGAMDPDFWPKDPGVTAAWLSGEISSNDIVEWVFSCPGCGVDLSDKPPRNVIILYADQYSEIDSLTEEKYHLQRLIQQHEKNLQRLEKQIAMHGEANAPIGLFNSRDKEREQIQTLQKELYTVKQRIQDKLVSLRL
jgi:hypothetical protein